MLFIGTTLVKQKFRTRQFWNPISSYLFSSIFLHWINYVLTLVLLNSDVLCLCKQCRSRSVSFWRRQLIWICTVCHLICEFVSTTWIKQLYWLTIRNGCGILRYSAWQGLIHFMTIFSHSPCIILWNYHSIALDKRNIQIVFLFILENIMFWVLIKSARRCF